MAALVGLVGLSGCPLSDRYYVESDASGGGTAGSNSSGGKRSSTTDTTTDAGATNGGAANGGTGGTCVFGPFGEPSVITGLGVGGSLYGPTLSADGLTLYFGAIDASATEHIYRSTRSSRDAPFATATSSAVNSTSSDGSPCLGFDDLTLYFYSTRTGGTGLRDLWRATRSSKSAIFGNSRALTGLNTTENDYHPWISRDERTLLYTSVGADAFLPSDIWMATRADKTVEFTEAARLSGISSTSREMRAALSDDALTIYFASDRSGGSGDIDLWFATRTDAQGVFSNANALENVNSAQADTDPTLSRDDTELYFSSSRSGSNQLWRAVRSCE